MAVNLRLRADAAAALREESARTGLSQQEILRRAVDEHLGVGGRLRHEPWPDWVEPPAEPLREPRSVLRFPPGRSSTDVLEDLRGEQS